jgi:hypothetical protein
MEQDLRTSGAIKHKHAMHLIRLLLAGVQVLRDGRVPVRVEDEKHRQRLLKIRRGEMRWEEAEDWRLNLNEELDEAFKTTRLPDQPDYERVNAFPLKARRSRA